MQYVTPQEIETEPPPRVVVVGVGRWGRNYVRELASRSALAAVVDPYLDPEEHTKLGEWGVPALGSLEEAIRQVDFDGAIISTPAVQHATTAEYLLAEGKHVLIEKPIAFSVDALSRLYATADERGLRVMSGHLLQHHPANKALCELCHSGKLGDIRFISSIRTSLGTVRREENVIWSFGPHDVGLAMSVMNREPDDVEVAAVATSTTVDVATLRLKFDGAEAHVHLNWLSPLRQQSLTVVGERGLAVFDDRAEPHEKLRVASYTVRHHDAVPGSSAVPLDVTWVPQQLDEQPPLARQVDEFLAAMSGATSAYEYDRWLTVGIVRTLERASAQIQALTERR